MNVSPEYHSAVKSAEPLQASSKKPQEFSGSDVEHEVKMGLQNPKFASLAPPRKTRHRDIDSLKALAILGVVIVHMEFPSRLSADGLIFIHKLQQVFGWCVMGFFFCAGVLAKPVPANQRDLGSFFIKRAKRLLLPCVVFSIAYKLALFLIGKTGAFSWRAPLPTGIREWLEFFFQPAAPQFYFLPYLFVISIGCTVLHMMFKRFWLLWGILASLHLLSPLWLSLPFKAHGNSPELILAYSYCFSTGVLIESFRGKQSTWFVFNVVLGLAAACLWRNAFFIYPLVPLVLLQLFKQIDASSRFIDITRLGENSGAIFVWHAPLLLPFCSIVTHWLFGVQFELVQVFLTITATVLLCYTIHGATRRFGWLSIFRF